LIELSRNITFGQYINNGTRLTRMDPRAKLLSAVLLIALFSYVASFTALALCLLCCVIIQWMSRIPVLYALRGFRLLVIFLSVLYILEVVFYTSPTQHTSLLWQWGIFNVSWEGITHSGLTIIRILLLFYLASMLLFTTSLVDLTDGSEALLAPVQKLGLPVNGLIMVLVIAFKFVPILVAEIERLIKAQTARGASFSRGSIAQRMASFGSLLVPLFVSAFRRAEALTIAMEARCYMGGLRGWRRSKRREMHLKRYDVLVLVFTIIFCVVTITVNFFAPF
jgi:energy-coupling factor transport system permease protein